MNSMQRPGAGASDINSHPRKNLRVVGVLAVIVSFMLGLVAYSPTLYRLFCVATGAGGTTERVDSNNVPISEKTITVRFDTNVAPGMPWRFAPVRRKVTVKLGEDTLVFFRAENLSDTPIVGHATFNVTPEKIGPYFKKIQCFCFDDERLEAHQKIDMPVDFFVDPALAQDPTTQEVNTITLSYTFFRTKDADKAKNLSRFVVSAEPDANRGHELFTQRCASCHAIDKNMAGPMLGGVFGRRAGSAAGYKYSPALLASGVTWTKDDLNRWLSDPRSFVPGSRMPIKILDPTSRRDLLAYLEQESRRALHAEASIAQHSR